MLKFIPFGEEFYAVYFNRIGLGDIEKDNDGYYYFWRNENLHGSESSHTLRGIADKLDELNAHWEAQVRLHLTSQDED